MPLTDAGSSMRANHLIEPAPAGTAPEPLKGAIERYQAAGQEWSEARARRFALERGGIAQAKAADSAELADALREGRDDPGPRQVQAVRAELEELQRREPALRSVAESAEVEMMAAARDPKVRAALDAQRETARSAALALLDQVGEACSALVEVGSVISWCRHPERDHRMHRSDVHAALAALRSALAPPSPPVAPAQPRPQIRPIPAGAKLIPRSA